MIAIRLISGNDQETDTMEKIKLHCNVQLLNDEEIKSVSFISFFTVFVKLKKQTKCITFILNLV